MKLFSAAVRRPEVVVALLLSIFAVPLHARAVDTNLAAVRPMDAKWVGKRYAAERRELQPQFLRTQHKEISRDQAAAIVKRHYGGKILAISEVQKDGRSMYRVKGLSEKSQVYVVYVDKQSGRISR